LDFYGLREIPRTAVPIPVVHSADGTRGTWDLANETYFSLVVPVFAEKSVRKLAAILGDCRGALEVVLHTLGVHHLGVELVEVRELRTAVVDGQIATVGASSMSDWHRMKVVQMCENPTHVAVDC
jgi:hypothetical protein